MLNKNEYKPSVSLADKRDYCLSSLDIKDENVKKVIYVCDMMQKSSHIIYDSIIFNKGVSSKEINKEFSLLKYIIDTLMEDLNE